MPIEIRELVIKATVVADRQAGGKPEATLNNDVSSQEAMIKICVDKVLEIEKDKKER